MICFLLLQKRRAFFALFFFSEKFGKNIVGVLVIFFLIPIGVVK